jgi:hypothetical protein
MPDIQRSFKSQSVIFIVLNIQNKKLYSRYRNHKKKTKEIKHVYQIKSWF